MVEFLSFFLALSTGVKPVELDVTAPVVEVSVQLDGRPVAVLHAAPWSFLLDLGPDPAAHELVAVGRDAAGREISRAVRWINLGLDAAARMSLNEDGAGRIESVGISWERVGQRQPPAIEVSFDGQPLAVDRPERVPLPDYDPASFHVVSATLRFADGVTRLDATFGGRYGEAVATELTALPIVLDGRARLPSRDKLTGWFVKDGHPLKVEGVEKGVADVWVVWDPAAQRQLERLVPATLAPRRSAMPRWRPHRSPPPPGAAVFDRRTELSFVTPLAAPLPAGDQVMPALFAHSARHPAADEGLLALAARVRPPAFPLRLAEAVAGAGMAANASGRRRAVVVILADGNDDSRWAPTAVRRYLGQLRVPLHVWTTAAGPTGEWGEARFVGAPAKRPRSRQNLDAAVRALTRDLARQRLVWLAGRHLPEEVELGPEAEGVRLAGETR